MTRIALIGDSMTMGHLEMFPKSIGWPKLMFDMVNNEANIEIINFGYSGTTVAHKSGHAYVTKPTYK